MLFISEKYLACICFTAIVLEYLSIYISGFCMGTCFMFLYMNVKYCKWLNQSLIVFLSLNETSCIFDNDVTILYSYQQFIDIWILYIPCHSLHIVYVLDFAPSHRHAVGPCCFKLKDLNSEWLQTWSTWLTCNLCVPCWWFSS